MTGLVIVTCTNLHLFEDVSGFLAGPEELVLSVPTLLTDCEPQLTVAVAHPTSRTPYTITGCSRLRRRSPGRTLVPFLPSEDLPAKCLAKVPLLTIHYS